MIMKLMIYVGASIGGLVGGYLPILLLHADALSGWSLLSGFVGTMLGLWAGYKVSQMMDI
jgi:hypothetical protein